MRYILLLVSLLANAIIYSQNLIGQWRFGHYAGIDFYDNGSVTANTNGTMHADEGCASVYDENGQLLFYTNGLSVRDRNDNVMPNGSGLRGHQSSTQSAIAVQMPGSSNKWYLFTVDYEASSDGIKYSIIDMNLNGGLGDVTAVKNVSLLSYTTEKITAVQHQNGGDFWIITHKFGTNQFFVYLLNSSGLSTTPIISAVGIIPDGAYKRAIGYLKASPDGSKLAMATGFMDDLSIFNFNKSTGTITSLMAFTNFNSYGPYGVEFSPNSNLLYVSIEDDPAQVWQFNLALNTPQDIAANATLVGTGGDGGNGGALQLGPDGKIYHCRWNSDYLGVISNPNYVGMACGYIPDGIYLNGQWCKLGLPNFNNKVVQAPIFTSNNNCQNDTSIFYIDNSFINQNSIVEWNFGDPSTGANNTSSNIIGKHVYSTNGNFTINLTIINNTDTLHSTNSIFINQLPNVNLGADDTLCQGEHLVIGLDNQNPSLNNLSYIWQNGSSATNINITTSGTYWVEVSNNGCTNSDTVNVNFTPNPMFSLGNDSIICVGDSILLTPIPTYNNASYQWSTGETNDSIIVGQQGNYTLIITKDECSFQDNVVITTYEAPTILLNDTSICETDTLQLVMNIQNVDFLWFDGSTNNFNSINEEGNYWLQVSNKCGLDVDSFSLLHQFIPPNNLLNDTTLCRNESTELSVYFDANTSYLWSNGDTLPYINIGEEGVYSVELVNICGSFNYQINVALEDCNCFLILPTGFSPNGDGINDIFKPITNCNIFDYKLIIYDRNRCVIFQSDNPEIGWDGFYKSQEGLIGVYIYNLHYRFEDTDINFETSNFTLIR